MPTMSEHLPGTSFVGRDTELRELLQGLTEAAAGRGRLYLVSGEPGIGKSRLADELAARARDSGMLALWGRGWEDAGAPPYWPWVQALRSYLRSADDATIHRELGAGAGDVAQLLPDVRQMLGDVALPAAADSESARFQLFDSTSTFIRNAALGRALLIVLDDLQAADTPSLLLLRFLATQLSEMRVLVLGTYRDVEVTPDHPLASALAELAREPSTRMLTLTGLHVGAVAKFIETAAGVDPPAHVVAAVWRETKGNPLFVGEAVRLLSAEGHIADGADLASLRVAVPAGIREVISRRIAQVADESVRALAIGAALGPEFSLDLLRRVGDFEPGELIDLLDPAVEAGLLGPAPGGALRYRFSHDLIRETLYGGIPLGRRIGLHRRIAEVLEGQATGAPDGHLAELAFHFYQASQAMDSADEAVGIAAEKAIAYARRAGEQAARSLAFEETERLLHMALAVLDVACPDDELQRTEILLALADAGMRAGDLDSSRDRFREAATIARRTGEVRHLARAALGYSGRLPWSRPGHDTSILSLLQDAIALLGGADDRLRVRLLVRLACAWRSSPERRTESDTLSQQAVALARDIGDAGTLSYALAGRYWATWWPENPMDRLEIAKEMVTVAQSSGDSERLIDAYFMLYMAYSEIPRVSEAHTALQQVIRLANELRQPSQRWLGVAPQALLALVHGDYEEAERLVEEELAWETPLTLVRDEVSAGRMHLFLLRREQGRLAEVEETVRAAVEDFPWYPLHRAALVNLLLDLDRTAEARAEFESLAEGGFRALYRDNEWLLGMSLAAEACSRLDDAASAAVLYEQLRPFAGRHATGHAEGSVGAVDRYLGLLAMTLSDMDHAELHLGEAIRVNELMKARPWVAHSQHDLAVALTRRDRPGDVEGAGLLLRTARATAGALQMTALEAKITNAQLGQPTEAAAAIAPPRGADVMFLREGDVWAIGREAVFRLKHSKGLGYLSMLLANPGREFHVLQLAGGDPGDETPRRVASSEAEALGLTSNPLDGDAILDAEARAAYGDRLRELRPEFDEADANGDTERAARIRAEIDALTAELSSAFGLGGRARSSGSAAERARQSVTKAIRDALRRIAAEDAVLGDHLTRAVRTGVYCSYDPDPAAAVTWRTDAAV